RKRQGFCGMGRIGAEVAKRAKAFQMDILGYDPYLTEARAEALGIKKVDLDELFANADYITVHMPLTDQTKYMIDEAAIEKMKAGVRLINCARGGIIKEEALVAGLESGKVAAAGLDVYESEPLAPDSPLRQVANLNLTPHLGASTKEAQESVGLEIAEAIAEVINGGAISNALNMPSLDAKTLESVGPYLDLCSHLGTLVQQLATDEIEEVSITLFGKVLELDGNSLARGVLKGFLQNISGGSSANFVNAFVVMERLGIQVETVKSNKETDYTELIRVEAKCANGEKVFADGTLIGKANTARIVNVNGREVEVEPCGYMLVVANEDRTGIVGQLGTIIGNDGVNIAAMSLSRNEVGGVALNIASLDTALSGDALAEIEGIAEIKRAKLVKV
ncbi:MAG: NAD(P)-dependent oxidoreductase, partial [Verrucomicrobiota bacterium]